MIDMMDADLGITPALLLNPAGPNIPDIWAKASLPISEKRLIGAIDDIDQQLMRLIVRRSVLHGELRAARRESGAPEQRLSYDNWVLARFGQALGDNGPALALLLMKRWPERPKGVSP
ncbi:hypothetical protein AB0M28_12920 [Streptomyces sp. NPDC051940]|uniref:hypothetical protein n=1 Tax=Streptomyces sp. NPDC051940 TaxID=3155675 RepID=UPI003414272C